MLDVAVNTFSQQPEQCDWSLSSSQSSVSGGNKQERSSSSSPATSLNSSVLKEHDYIGMNEVSSLFKGSARSENVVSHLNLQETELRLGPLKNSSLPERCTGASFQPKSETGSLTSAATVAAAHSNSDESSGTKVLDLGINLVNQPNVVDGEKKPSEMAVKSLSLVAEATVQKENCLPFMQQENNKLASKSGAKRVFAEAIGGEGASFADGRTGFPSHLSKLNSENPFTQLSKHPLLPPLYPWKAAKQQSFLSPKPGKVEDGETVKAEAGDDVEASSTRAPVGWPPVQSFRKTTLAVPQSPKKQPENQKSVMVAAAPQIAADPVSPFVKVYMDGLSIGRKVEIKYDDSYEKLVAMLEEMFQYHISGQNPKEKLPGETKKLNFLSSDSEFVLTYEDKDGDLMLVGDVPWKMFVGTVKRLRIMKGTDAIGLAPRGSSD